MSFPLFSTYSFVPPASGFSPIEPMEGFDGDPIFESRHGMKVLRPATPRSQRPSRVATEPKWPAYQPGSRRRERQEWRTRAEDYIRVTCSRKRKLAIQSRQARWQPLDTVLVGMMLKGDSEGLNYGMSLIEKHLSLDRHGLICGGWMQKPGETLALETPPFDAHLPWLTELQLKTLLTFFILYFREQFGPIHHGLSPAYLLLYRSQNYLSEQGFKELLIWLREIHSEK